ncbi:hypothetical protein INT43_008437 [Umbelopsis isabellina]|uniref:DNA-binding protein RAP1 n=1 Tax=Mortierella isabellina TaxID=91625 RepID=A0A8H7PV90_MORIS|nr:hypothetical protein INT43_008437 [Umbelopsis isabellina]
MEQSDLFANHSFYIADSEPSKEELAATIKVGSILSMKYMSNTQLLTEFLNKNFGGRITKTSKDGKPVWLGSREHTKNAKELVDLTYITDCIKKKKVLPRNKYLILGEGPASRAGTRRSFTAKDKRILRDWVQRQEHFGYRLGEKIYKELSEIVSDAWQNHWKRNIEPTLTREQRMAYLKGNAAPDPVSEDEDGDEDKVVEQQQQQQEEEEEEEEEEENNNAEETVQIVVQTESDTIETYHTDASHSQKNKQASDEAHSGSPVQSSKRVTRSNTQQANTQTHEHENEEDLLQTQTSRRVLRSSAAKQTNSDPATSTSSQPAPARDQSEQGGDENNAPLNPAIIEAVVNKFFGEEPSPSAASKKNGKRQALADEHESQKSNKAAKLDSSQLPIDSEEDSVSSTESTLSQCEKYVMNHLPWNGTYNLGGNRIYYFDRRSDYLGGDVLRLMELSSLDIIELRDVSDPRWRSFAEWCIGPYQPDTHTTNFMSPGSPSQEVAPHQQSSKSKASHKVIQRHNHMNDPHILYYPRNWKQFGDDVGDFQHNADRASPFQNDDSKQQEPRRSIGTSTSRQPHIRGLQYKPDRSPSYASPELRQQQPSSNTITTSRQPSTTHSSRGETSHNQSIIDATASNEAKHIRRALTQKTYNNVSSVTDADHKRWLMDIRGLMMDYDMTAFQIIRAVRSFSGDWEAARAFLHQLKNKSGSNTSNTVSGNVRIDMLLRDRDQLTRLAWSEKHDNILKGGVASEIDNLILQKGRNNTLARQQFLKFL